MIWKRKRKAIWKESKGSNWSPFFIMKIFHHGILWCVHDTTLKHKAEFLPCYEIKATLHSIRQRVFGFFHYLFFITPKRLSQTLGNTSSNIWCLFLTLSLSSTTFGVPVVTRTSRNFCSPGFVDASLAPRAFLSHEPNYWPHHLHPFRTRWNTRARHGFGESVPGKSWGEKAHEML